MVLILHKNTSGSARSMSTSSSAILMLVGFVLSNQFAWPGGVLLQDKQPTQRRGWPRGGSQGRWRPDSQLREDSVGRNGQRSYGGPHGGRPTSPTGRWRLSLCSYSCARHLWGKKWFNEKYFILKNTTNCGGPHGGPTSPTGRWRCLCSYSCARPLGRKTDLMKSFLYCKNTTNCIHLID